MVHDADTETDLNTIIPKLSNEQIKDFAQDQAKQLAVSFEGLNTSVFIVGLGAFGPNYETKADFVASACPFCNTMMTDGIKNRDEEVKTEVLDIAEIIAKAIQ